MSTTATKLTPEHYSEHPNQNNLENIVSKIDRTENRTQDLLVRPAPTVQTVGPPRLSALSQLDVFSYLSMNFISISHVHATVVCM